MFLKRSLPGNLSHLQPPASPGTHQYRPAPNSRRPKSRRRGASNLPPGTFLRWRMKTKHENLEYFNSNNRDSIHKHMGCDQPKMGIETMKITGVHLQKIGN